MKVYKDEDNNYVICTLIKDNSIDITDKESIVKIVKDLILKINRLFSLHLRGFYKVRVYFNEKIGVIMEIINIDDININNTIDLRVIVYLEQDFYFEVVDYDYLPKGKKIIFYDDKYYISIKSLTRKEVLGLFDLGEMIYKNDAIDTIKFGKIICN